MQTHKTLLMLLPFALLLGAPGCDSSDNGNDDAAEAGDGDGDGDEDPYDGAFDDCTREFLEEDLVVIDTMGNPGPVRWYGPGADPETGELIDDGETEYHVSVTYLALRPENIEQFLGLIPNVNQALFSNPGLVAVQLADSQQCATARTLTVWTDEAAMYEFVGSQAHVDAIVAFPDISRGQSTLASFGGVKASDITWDRALAELEAAEAYD